MLGAELALRRRQVGLQPPEGALLLVRELELARHALELALRREQLRLRALQLLVARALRALQLIAEEGRGAREFLRLSCFRLRRRELPL